MENLINKLYYLVKPLIPRAIQLSIRRSVMRNRRNAVTAEWPILERAGNKPDNWKGWLNGKQFAFVLTHDVEFAGGQEKCIELMNIEKSLGFGSSFNFVPERYQVDKSILKELVKNGFEVGVHGLNHDGKLFKNKNIFDKRTIKINEYLKDWKAVGFRSPAMHHNLDWIHKLNIEYDASTFDTDPFEPQSKGIETIFPFIVFNETDNGNYIELPYTLPQDHSVFIIFEEKNIDIWKKKIDWIAEKGGMALLNTHPDYICFNVKPGLEEFPVDLYKDFLSYVKSEYAGLYWHALPKDISAYIRRVLKI